MDHSLIGALSASRAAAQIRAGTLSCEELMLSCLARIAQREPQVGAWQFLDATRALERARAADKLAPQGPLHGIPVGIKDIIDTVDMPTTLGSQIYAKRQPQWDAACVAALRAAGAIVLGKTVSTEFAYFQPGKTRHPHDLLHTPGGSSSGSAAAVADFMVPVALGSQTAASVTRPAAFCGVYGYKASHGEFSLSGIRPFAESLDSLGVLARSVDDIVLMRSVLLGGIPIDHRPLAAPPRLAVCRTAQWSQAEPQAQNALETVVQACRKAGSVVSELELPAQFAGLIDAQKKIMAYEAAHNYVFETTSCPGQLSAAFLALTESGRNVSRHDYASAKCEVELARNILRRLATDLDAWISPAAIGEAPLATSGTGDPLMSRMWTALQGPSLCVPVGRGAQGLPLAVQLVALAGHDDELLQAGLWVGTLLETA
jgi:Asp-tRNA(Asn)/Glu-tRNA(Gln) amidotransferase A subunit family amidase